MEPSYKIAGIDIHTEMLAVVVADARRLRDVDRHDEHLRPRQSADRWNSCPRQHEHPGLIARYQHTTF